MQIPRPHPGPAEADTWVGPGALSLSGLQVILLHSGVGDLGFPFVEVEGWAWSSVESFLSDADFPAQPQNTFSPPIHREEQDA